ncbi:cyclin-D-binding Myb-like transcription factor 1 [Patiria miniata]|uniref:Cyclin-D-binding Myb-like transcription factor 1 n=1 Tax=Patiria miniata TaxID=46514 RepID=A0A914BDP8_PATMI|nr:cyclin-D-binding Myb-like transcription factor 1 [Patiria miniata]
MPFFIIISVKGTVFGSNIMETSHSDDDKAEVSSPACLVLPVNPLPSTSSDQRQALGKAAKRKARKPKFVQDTKSAKILTDFAECSDVKQEMLDSTDDVIEGDVSEASEAQDTQESLASPSRGMPCEEVPIDPVTQSWFTSRDSKDNLSKKGHKWKQGMWSKEEVDILERNIEEYLKIRKLGDAVSVIFQMSKEERKDFYRFIAKGLQRPLFAVYRRVIRMYDSKNHVGKYTAEDIQKLKELRAKYGNEWCAIGAEMGRSAASVKDKVRLLKDRCHQGKWTINEEQMLAEAVYSLSKAAPGESITTGISWSQIAAKVPTRTEKQCRAKWLNYLNWKHAGGTEWTKDDDNKLLDRLLESDATNDNQVNWEELAKNWRSVRSPQWLRSKWWMLKRHVPGHEEMNLAALVEHLRTSPMGSRHMKPLRGSKCMTRDINVSVPMATLTVPMGTTSEQVDVYQYEVLETSMGLTPSSTYVIQSTAHQGEASTAEGYIVANLQGEQLQSNDNVTVHLNHLNRRLLPSGQIVISAVSKHPVLSTNPRSGSSTMDYVAVSAKRGQQPALAGNGEDNIDGLVRLPVRISIEPPTDIDNQSDPSEENSLNQPQLITSHDGQLSGDISQSEQSEDNPLNQSEIIRGHDSRLTGDMSQSDQSEEHSLSNQSQLIGTDAVLTQQDMVPEVSEEPETQLVIVNTAPSTGLMQPVGSVDDTQLAAGVFSLSGQILQSQSDGSDLLESPTSVESMTREKLSSPSSSELS